MNTKVKQALLFAAGMIAGILLIAQFSFKEGDEKTSDPVVKRDDQKTLAQWRAPSLPGQMSFAGEQVPLNRPEIRQQFDRELLLTTYNQGHVLYVLKLTKRYFPLIEERLKANGVPEDFKYLCVAESNLQNLKSRAGAVGYWQFMPKTAPGYGMEVSNYVDDRYHIIKSTDAACAYLKKAYTRFGNWTAAAASYNCGMGGYGSRATFQQTNNYYDLMLPDETNKYIFRILSFKYILSDPERSGFHVDEDDLYDEIPVKTVVVDRTISNLAQWAIDNGTTYKRVKILNPWLRGKSLYVKSGKKYMVKVPTDTDE